MSTSRKRPRRLRPLPSGRSPRIELYALALDPKADFPWPFTMEQLEHAIAFADPDRQEQIKTRTVEAARMFLTHVVGAERRRGKKSDPLRELTALADAVDQLREAWRDLSPEALALFGGPDAAASTLMDEQRAMEHIGHTARVAAGEVRRFLPEPGRGPRPKAEVGKLVQRLSDLFDFGASADHRPRGRPVFVAAVLNVVGEARSERAIAKLLPKRPSVTAEIPPNSRLSEQIGVVRRR